MIVVHSQQEEGSQLTTREAEILEHVAAGHSAKQIAQQVGLAPRTVERYIENLRHKLGARNRTHLIAVAIARGDLEIESRKSDG